MVGRSMVFRFFMDIREFVQKGRQAVKVTNDINQSTQRASGGVRQLESSMASAGRQSAASAVNFQTMTQGMLNLSTAGVQTFTSMSNLDRAGNRLAQSQIAVCLMVVNISAFLSVVIVCIDEIITFAMLVTNSN